MDEEDFFKLVGVCNEVQEVFGQFHNAFDAVVETCEHFLGEGWQYVGFIYFDYSVIPDEILNKETFQNDAYYIHGVKCDRHKSFKTKSVWVERWEFSKYLHDTNDRTGEVGVSFHVEDMMSEWISVDDELPTITTNQFSHETDVIVWATLPTGSYHAVDRLIETDDGPMFRCAIFDKAVVTHWMPLPVEPK